VNDAPAATVLHADEMWTCARFRNVLVVVWKKDTELGRVRKGDAAIRALADSSAATGHDGGHPQTPGVGMVVVIEPGTRLPGQEARREMVAGMRSWGHHLRAMACVVPASGFSGSAARAVLNSMMLLTKSPAPTRVFSETTEAATWTAELLGGAFRGEELHAAIEAARR
jgi:hypothetical protein